MPDVLGNLDAGEILIDLEHWPVIIMTIPTIVALDAIDLHFQRTTELIAPRGQYCSVMDASKTDPMRITAAHRRHAAAGLEALRDTFDAVLVSEAYVLKSAIARGVLTAIRWLSPSRWPVKNFSNLDDAIEWSWDIYRGPRRPSMRAKPSAIPPVEGGSES